MDIKESLNPNKNNDDNLKWVGLIISIVALSLSLIAFFK